MERNVGAVLYFIFALIAIIFSFIIIWGIFSEDRRPDPVDILSLETNLFFTVRKEQRYLTADSLSDLFFTSWNLEFDPSGTGAVTLRNAYNNKWIYFEPDDEGNSDRITVDLEVRQGADIDPIGWFYIENGGQVGSIYLRSLVGKNKYMFANPFGVDILSFVGIGDMKGEFIIRNGFAE